MRTKLAAPLLGVDAADHLDGVQYEITDGFGRGVPGARAVQPGQLPGPPDRGQWPMWPRSRWAVCPPHFRRRAREESSFAISTPLPRLRARSIPEAGRGTGYRAF